MIIEQGAVLTQEDSSEKLIAEAYRHLVECGKAAVDGGQWCDVVCRLTYKGGQAVSLEISNPRILKTTDIQA